MGRQRRLDYHALAPNAAKALGRFSFAAGGTLDSRLRELVNLRISQVNGCACCIDMHWAALLNQGVGARYVNAVAGWRKAHRLFSGRERAALNWAEAVNGLPHRVAIDDDFEEVRRHLSDAEVADLTFAVGAIRCWNMLNASFHTPVQAQTGATHGADRVTPKSPLS